jgi:hypothetical protein
MSEPNAEVRGALLRALYEARPYAVEKWVLLNLLRSANLPPLPRLVDREMEFLIEARYAELFGAARWRITNSGVALVEGAVRPDPNVVFPAAEGD